MTDAVASMADAARALLESLHDESAHAGRIPFDDDERTNWHYTPRRRRGVPLGRLDPAQHKLALRLLASGLSLPAFAKATTIIALEDVLDRLEGGGSSRSPAWYFTSVFGEPGADRWAWRFEGHHVCVNWTVSDGDVRCTPLFLGANPAVVAHGGRDASRPLREEEEAARDLLRSLDDDQRVRAVICPVAPSEILTGNARSIDGPLRPGDVAGLAWEPMSDEHNAALEYGNGAKGIESGDLDARQRALLTELVRAYVDRAPAEVAERELDGIDGAGLHFAWAGDAEPGRAHYYRVEGRSFLAEYDNWQNDANHIHAVWRSPGRDFADDLLARHQSAHRGVRRAAQRGGSA